MTDPLSSAISQFHREKSCTIEVTKKEKESAKESPYQLPFWRHRRWYTQFCSNDSDLFHRSSDPVRWFHII
jgi:hypothetical protein